MALQQIANTDISSTGTFALGSVSSSALTSGRVTYATTGGLLTDSSSLTYDGTTLTSTKFAGALNGTVGATTPSTVVATSVTNSGLTSGRITYASTGGLLVDSANLVFSGTNVGIGTASPAAKLDLGGNTASTVQQIFGRGVTDTDFTVRYTNGAAGTSAFIGTLGLDYGNGAFADMATIKFYRNSVAGELAFFASASGVSGTEKLRITSTTLHTANGVSVGIGTDSPYGLLNIKGSNGQLVLANGNTSGGMKLTASNSTYTGNGYLAFEGYANEYGRFDSSGNFGIGATSLAANLHISKSTTATVMISNILTTLVTDDAMGLIDFSAGSSNTVNARISGLVVGTSEAGGSLAIETRTDGGSLTEKFRITGAGNVGIGQTSPTVKLDILNTNATYSLSQRIFNASAGQFFIGQSPAATFLSVDNFDLAFCTNSNGGVAGSSVPTNERMRIDNAGNVGIGLSTISAFAKLEILGTAGAQTGAAQQLSIIGRTTTAGQGAGIRLSAASGSNEAVGIIGVVNNASGTSGSMTFHVYNGGGDIPEHMRITNAGNVLVGTTSVSATSEKVSIQSNSTPNLILRSTGNSSMRFYNSSDNAANSCQINYYSGTSFSFETIPAIPMVFLTNNTERMRINAAGYLKVSNTGTYQSSSSSNHELRTNSSSDFSTYITNSSATTPYGLEIQFTAAAPNNTSQSFCLAEDTANLRFVVMANGGIKNFQGNDVNLSDRREKTNFAPAKSYLNVICAIPVQTFNYIDQNREEDDGLTLGVVAQDVQAVAPELVMESNWANKDDEPKMRLSIYQTDLQYALMKCIQEQQALIESMAAKLKDAGVAGF